METFILPLAREHPEWIKVQAELTDYWWTRERFQEALAVLETRLQAEPDSKAIWRKIIEAHLRLGQNERAAERVAESPAGTANYLFELQLEKDGLEMPGVRP
jgi:thioredoxin-like negative regulator of GroEL